MCLAVPALIMEKNGALATVEIGGITREASLVLLPDAEVGDYVLIHAGFAISVVDKQEARDTLTMLRELLEGGSPGGFSQPAGDEPLAGDEPAMEG